MLVVYLKLWYLSEFYLDRGKAIKIINHFITNFHPNSHTIIPMSRENAVPRKARRRKK